MIKLIVAVICTATLLTSKATADEAYADPAATGPENTAALTREVTRNALPGQNGIPGQNAFPGMDQEAMREALLCKINSTCGTLSDEDRARAALALLFLRISENCNQQPCMLRLVKSP